MTEELQRTSDISIDIDQKSLSIIPGVKKGLNLKIRNDRDAEREHTIGLRIEAGNFPVGSITTDWRDETVVFPGDEQSAVVTILLPTNPLQPPSGTYLVSIRAIHGDQEMANGRVEINVELVAEFEVGSPNVEQNGQNADFRMRIQNKSNAPLRIHLGDAQPADQLRFELDSSEVPPTESGQAMVTVKPKVPVTEERTDEVRIWLKGGAVDKDGMEHAAPERPDHRLSAEVTWKPLGPALVLAVVEPLPELAPGDPSVLKLKLKNHSGAPQKVRLTVEGDGSDWFTPPADPVEVGVGEESEKAIDIPVEAPTEFDQALAGIYPLKVLAKSQDGQEAKPVEVEMKVSLSGEPTIKPPKLDTQIEQKAEFQLRIENQTNATLRVGVDATQPESELDFKLDPDPLNLDPTGTENAILTVQPKESEQPPKEFTFVMDRVFLDKDGRELKPPDDWTVPVDWPSPQLTITQPSEQEHVPRETRMTGTFQNLPVGMVTWLYVYAPVEGKYYLGKIVTVNQTTGTWEAQSVIIGSDDDFGQLFTVGVLLANSAANSQLEAQSKGLDNLPEGVQKFSEITVIRESRPDDAIPEMVAFQGGNFKGYYHNCNSSKFQENHVKLINDRGKWVIDRSFIIKSGFWCIWPKGSLETFELLGPGEYENKSVCRCRAIPTQGITLFDDTYFGGKMINLTGSDPWLGQSHDFNDKISSVIVSTGNWRLWKDANYKGHDWKVNEGESHGDFSKAPHLHDGVSSVERLS